MLVLFLLIGFCSLLFLGIPICISLGFTGLIGMIYIGGFEFLSTAVQRIYFGITPFPLLAVPFFILTGVTLNHAGLTDKLFNFAKNIMGAKKGALAHANVLASIIFAGMSGSAVADAAGLGLIEIKAMREDGYDKNFAAAVTVASSTIGPLIPPSIPFVIIGSMTGVSIGQLFIGGLIPGLLLGLSQMITIALMGRYKEWPKSLPVTIGILLKSCYDAFPVLLVPVIIICGMLFGYFTATEASVIASLYSILISMFLYRSISMADLFLIFRETSRCTIQILIIMGAAHLFTWILIYEGVPGILTKYLFSFSESRIFW